MSRAQNILSASTELFDVVIIGGGITGAGIALAAAKRGWKTLIIDKNDFASGTSSRSAKMIHGGLRYLQQLQISLVKEALHEREHLLKEYPHLVKPQPFFMPIYKSKLIKLKLAIGLSGYDYLSGSSSMPKHAEIDLEDIKQRFPSIKSDSMVGGFIYYDAKTNDARLTNEVIQEAKDLGSVAINYFTCVEFGYQNEKIKSILCVDENTKNQYAIRAKIFINATGIWTGETIRKYNPNDAKKYMAPSKGVHLIVHADHLPKDAVMLFPTASGDGRFIWCMPWEDNLNVVGTTDTDYLEGKENLKVQHDEVKYILDSVNAQLKEKQITEDDILSVYAGLRPLINDEDEDKKSNKRSRDYQIWWNNENMLTISGGKLTSFLSMADSVLNTIDEKYKIHTIQTDEVKLISLIDQYKERYGIKNATLIANIIAEYQDNSINQQLENYPYTIAEFIFFIRYQFAIKLDDLLTRRTLISYQMKVYDEAFVNQLADVLCNELKYNAAQIADDKVHYYNQWLLMHSWE
jgi:glycerol-3-phosphate dehydrogenase